MIDQPRGRHGCGRHGFDRQEWACCQTIRRYHGL